MELEEVIKIYNELKPHKKIIKSIDTDFFFKFVETVLQELKNRIPKKKIEDKKKECEEKYDSIVNDVYKKPTEALIDFQRIVGAKEVLQELLEDKN